MVFHTPKLIVYGVKEFNQLNEIIALGKNFKYRNFDIAKMGEGIISLVFETK